MTHGTVFYGPQNTQTSYGVSSIASGSGRLVTLIYLHMQAKRRLLLNFQLKSELCYDLVNYLFYAAVGCREVCVLPVVHGEVKEITEVFQVCLV